MATVSSNILKDTELIANPRKVVQNYLNNNTTLTIGVRKQILKLYDNQINKDNIRYYLNRKIKVFILALVQDKLETIRNYYPKTEAI